jgi:hypothetical protein
MAVSTGEEYEFMVAIASSLGFGVEVIASYDYGCGV